MSFRDAPIAHLRQARDARRAALRAAVRARVAGQRGACMLASSLFEDAVYMQGQTAAHLTAAGQAHRSAAKRAVKDLSESINQARTAVRRCKL